MAEMERRGNAFVCLCCWPETRRRFGWGELVRYALRTQQFLADYAYTQVRHFEYEEARYHDEARKRKYVTSTAHVETLK